MMTWIGLLPMGGLVVVVVVVGFVAVSVCGQCVVDDLGCNILAQVVACECCCCDSRCASCCW